MNTFHRSAVETFTTSLHGRPASYRIVHGPEGSPTVLAVHGMAGTSRMWEPSMGFLGSSATVVAPDLLGHGGSAKFRGDYSLGNQASFLRDLLVLLGIERVTLLGQSLGGGVAMQTAYQYPQMCERLVLVDSGGLGPEVALLLRLLALPGSGLALSAATAEPIRRALRALTAALGRVGLQVGSEESEMLDAYESLADDKTRKAFLATLRSVVDHAGQRVSARDRLHLSESLPTMVIWGEQDRIIPVTHAHDVIEAVPHARLEIIEGAGHFPHCHDPFGFAALVADFLTSTEPARMTPADLARRLAD